MSTIQSLITRVERELSQAAGSGVQLYADDRIADQIVTAFNLVFEEDWWPFYCNYYQRTLDGSTGFITSDIPITRSRDLRAIWRSGSDKQLPLLPFGSNPYNYVGTNPYYVQLCNSPTGQTRPFRIWPLASVDDLVIHGREYPASFTLNTNILFDDDLIAFGAAWQYSADDGHNPAQITKFQKLFDTKLKQIQRDILSNLPTQLDPRMINIPSEWQQIS